MRLAKEWMREKERAFKQYDLSMWHLCITAMYEWRWHTKLRVRLSETFMNKIQLVQELDGRILNCPAQELNGSLLKYPVLKSLVLKIILKITINYKKTMWIWWVDFVLRSIETITVSFSLVKWTLIGHFRYSVFFLVVSTSLCRILYLRISLFSTAYC